MSKLIYEKERVIIKHSGLFFAFMLTLYLLLSRVGISEPVFYLVLGHTGLLGSLFVLFGESIKKNLYAFKSLKPGLIAVFLTSGLLLQVIYACYRYIAYRNGLLVDPGASQVNIESFGFSVVEKVLVGITVILISPFWEELLFRHVDLGIAFKHSTIPSAAKVPKKSSTPLLKAAWIITVSVAFALLHGPGKTSFPMYFASSLVYSAFYLKYGLWASTLVHSSGNAGAYILKLLHNLLPGF